MSRIKQFILDVAAPIREVDEAFPVLFLNSLEWNQLKKLRRAEILHVIAVAKQVKAYIETDSLLSTLEPEEHDAIVKAALLHDLGKIHHRVGPIAKSMTVLLNKLLKNHSQSLARWKAWDIYKNHPEYGFQLATDLKSFAHYSYLADLVRYHHQMNLFYSKYKDGERRVFDLFLKADENN